jgi:DNA polymerase
MSLDLDTRQRAMLQEMGVRVWLPAPIAAGAPGRTIDRLDSAIENRAANAMPMRAVALKGLDTEISSRAAERASLKPDEIAAMDWPTLTQAVMNCQACLLCVGRRAPVFAAADAPCRSDWLVLGEPPDEAEERSGQAYVEHSGQLLDNMLKALDLRRHPAGNNDQDGTQAAHTAYISQVVKCRPAVARNPTAQELATCENFLRREVALVQPKVILALGRYAAQTLLQGSVANLATTPLGKLRGQVHAYQGVPVVVSYPPSYLLRSQKDKARAWADLCRARAVIGAY